ncbi:HTH-type transcriptional activator IlvY [Salinispira pacifica]
MDYHSLELFLHLSSTLHFGRTSDACNISPSALSRTIQRMEEETGARLFIRDRRSVSLTEEGRRFREHARETLERWTELTESFASTSGQLRGEVMLYCSVTAAQTVLSGIFGTFRERYPGVHIRLETGDSAYAIERILDGSADLTVAARPDTLPDPVLFAPLAVTPLLFIAPRMRCRVAQQTAADPVPWKEVPMILADRALSRRRSDDWFREKRIRPTVYAEVAGHEAIIAMVSLGCGVGVVPKLVLDQSPLRNSVRVLNVSPQLSPYHVGICVHRRRLESPIVKAFWEAAAGDSAGA